MKKLSQFIRWCIVGLIGTSFLREFLWGGADVIFALPIVNLLIAIFSPKNSTTKNQAYKAPKTYGTNMTNAQENKILNNMALYFKNSDRIYFDQENYIEPADYGNIQLDTLNMYMRNEYIGTLADYKLAFPASYNTFMEMVGEYVRKKRYTAPKATEITKPVQEKPKVEETKEQTESIQTHKDAKFYIDTINELNDKIPEEHMSEGLDKTVLYLEQIKKIEDTFPNCKDKTTKLYQYYLPMLTEILENYRRLSINADLHKEFKENEDRLRKTVLLINSALQTLSQNLCDEYYTEMSVDMKTLEALLKKDGLADDLSFERMQKEKKVESNGN